jgi:hypothetical protein
MNPDTASGFWKALQQQQWPVVVGFVIVFLIYGANRFGLQAAVGPKWIPVISIALGILSAIGAQLVLGISWVEAIVKGFLAGASATGLWEVGLKRMLPAIPAATSTDVAKASGALKVDLVPAGTPPVKARRKPGPKPGSKKIKAAEALAATPAATTAVAIPDGPLPATAPVVQPEPKV